MGVTYSQCRPPVPVLTESNLPDQSGKVFVVTGGAGGIGLELCRLLYRAGGKVYIVGRSKVKAQSAITQIKESSTPTNASGELHFLYVALDDLSTIKPAVESFTMAESRLDVLFNNAGVQFPPTPLSPQNHEMHMATNCLGPYLLTQLLLPLLISTVKSVSQPRGSVRVVWTSPISIEFGAPNGGIIKSHLTDKSQTAQQNYVTTKVGNWFLASELAREAGREGVLSIAQNPGNLVTPMMSYLPNLVVSLISPTVHAPIFGAYTELWAGLSPELTLEDAANGVYIIPWGRKHPAPRRDLLDALKPTEEGGTGQAQMFKDYCAKQTERFR